MSCIPEQSVKVLFWGTRGSLPVSMPAHAVRSKLITALQRSRKQIFANDAEIANFIDHSLPFSVWGTYGGNTSCVEIKGGEEYMICDAGTGIRDMGNSILAKRNVKQKVFNIFLSHLHWDHIQGFPFFAPAYIPGNRINIYGFHHDLENAVTGQQMQTFFPVPLEAMKAEIRFVVLDTDKEYELGGFRMRGIVQNHPGDSYGYRFDREGKSVVYSTDSEYKQGDRFTSGHTQVEFVRNADLLVFDAQYVFSESVDSKEHWGHSSNMLGVELAVNAGVRRLLLFHHDPGYDDGMLDSLREDTKKYAEIYSGPAAVEVDLAYDGLEISI